MKASYLRNVGRNRGVARVWLEGEMLLSNGWNNGDRFNVTFAKGALVYEKHPAGKRKVAGTPDRPILDTNTRKLSTVCGFSTGDKLPVTVTPDKVTVGEAVSADKVSETVSFVGDKLQENIAREKREKAARMKAAYPNGLPSKEEIEAGRKWVESLCE